MQDEPGSTVEITAAATVSSMPVQQRSDVVYTETRDACSHRKPFREALFGDLHVHTALSTDAYQQGVRTRPEDAYNFARGRTIPFHNKAVKIDRPLDFAAVTDHAEYLGDLARCVLDDDSMYSDKACVDVREGSGASYEVLEAAFESDTVGSLAERATRALGVLFESENPVVNSQLCGDDGEGCAIAGGRAWQEILTAAENAYDRSSACTFTTFVAYEYTGVLTGSNYHRNVIFRNEAVPGSPVTFLDAPRDHLLWEQLDRQCTQGVEGCAYLTIPHNSNLSNGKMFTPDYSSTNSPGGESDLASARQRAEPLMEIYQHKGQSECINGLDSIRGGYDEFCEFEQVRRIGGSTTILGVELETAECRDESDAGDGGMIDTGCISSNDYLRGALLTGLSEEIRLGVNPLKLGVIASTDTHESIPGAVDEESWPGHVGREEALSDRLALKTGLPYRLDGSAGGLAGVWAVENSRDAIFESLLSRETFGTSGPRIRPRLFAGWSFSGGMCDQQEFAETGYEGGCSHGE